MESLSTKQSIKPMLVTMPRERHVCITGKRENGKGVYNVGIGHGSHQRLSYYKILAELYVLFRNYT